MRVKNKEIRKRRHRKEQVIKAAIRAAKTGEKAEKKVSAPAAEKPRAIAFPMPWPAPVTTATRPLSSPDPSAIM